MSSVCLHSVLGGFSVSMITWGSRQTLPGCVSGYISVGEDVVSGADDGVS